MSLSLERIWKSKCGAWFFLAICAAFAVKEGADVDAFPKDWWPLVWMLFWIWQLLAAWDRYRTRFWDSDNMNTMNERTR